ncbi:unnamed protein product [Boreogadus saida]
MHAKPTSIAGVSSTDVLVTGPSPLPTYCDTSPGCGDLHAGPNDPGLTSGSRIGSAQLNPRVVSSSCYVPTDSDGMVLFSRCDWQRSVE